MKTKNVRGATFSYGDEGTGPAVVLLHGFPLDQRIWAAQTAELRTVCRVITPDLRGFGGSRDEQPFTIESLADDVHVLLESIGALPCVLGGLSMGGYVALAYVRKYGSDLHGLALIDTRAEADAPEAKQGRQKMIDMARTAGAKAVADQMMPKMLQPGTDQRRPDVARALRDVMEACPPLTIEHALAAMRDRPDLSGWIGSIKTPTLIIVGEHDVITPPAVAETMHKSIVNSTLKVIADSGHMAPMEQPTQVNQSLSTFVEEVAGA